MVEAEQKRSFSDWFEGSKIVDETGAPLLVYHGTDRLFSEFSDKHLGSNTAFDNTNMGFFFIADKTLAATFAQNTSGGSYIVSAYLDIKKPINLTPAGVFSIKEQAPTLWEIFVGERLSEDDALVAINEGIGLGEFDDIAVVASSEYGMEILVRDGYDGAISPFGDGHHEYIVFKPEQIRIVDTEDIRDVMRTMNRFRP